MFRDCISKKVVFDLCYLTASWQLALTLPWNERFSRQVSHILKLFCFDHPKQGYFMMFFNKVMRRFLNMIFVWQYYINIFVLINRKTFWWIETIAVLGIASINDVKCRVNFFFKLIMKRKNLAGRIEKSS